MIDLPSIQKTQLDTRKRLGRVLLYANKIEEALRIFARILQEDPQDIEAYLVMGDCYLVEGDGETARLLYSQAQRLAPDAPEIQRRLKLAQLESQPAPTILSGDLLEDPAAVSRLLEQLTGGQGQVSDAEVAQANGLLRQIIQSSDPARIVAEHLEEIDNLMPALLELNIRQAQVDGRPDLARALQDLSNEIRQKIADLKQVVPEAPCEQPALASPSQPRRRLLFISPSGGESLLRQTLAAETLSGSGCEVTLATRFPPDFQERYDLVIAHNPHGNPELVSGLAICAAEKIPILLDLDTDFERLPANHPDYPAFGLGTPSAAKAYTASLLLANLISVPNETLAHAFEAKGYRVQVIPDGWSQENALWKKIPAQHHSLNLGWIGGLGQLEDMALIRMVVIRTLREFPQARLIVVGDAQVYYLFNSLPESRRLFLPTVNVEDQPYLLGQIDILLAPLRNIPSNQGQPDRRLMEAGIRRIPWVASPVPSFKAWREGGLLAGTPEEWHTHLRQLILDKDMRATLGEAGWRKAETREMKRLGKIWLEALEMAMQVQHG